MNEDIWHIPSTFIVGSHHVSPVKVTCPPKTSPDMMLGDGPGGDALVAERVRKALALIALPCLARLLGSDQLAEASHALLLL